MASIRWQSFSQLVATCLADETLIKILWQEINSQIDVSQHEVMYGTHSSGCSSRWTPHPDSSCRDRRAIMIILPMESHQKTWSVKCSTPQIPCSMLIYIRAMPQSSFRPNATWQGKDLITPSLLRIAFMACHWILFRVLVSSVVTGRVCHWRDIRTVMKDECIHLAQPWSREMNSMCVALCNRSSASFW